MVCGKKTEVFSRAVGYYRPIEFWNIGKRAELQDRVYYTIYGRVAQRKSSPHKGEVAGSSPSPPS